MLTFAFAYEDMEKEIGGRLCIFSSSSDYMHCEIKMKMA